MNVLRVLMLIAAIASLALPAAAQDADRERVAKFTRELDAQLPALSSEDPATRAGAQKTFGEFCLQQAGRSGEETTRSAVSLAIAARIGPQTAPVARQWLLQQLQWIGRAEAVPAVADVLGDQDSMIREAARLALQHNPSEEAGAALRAALAQANDPAWQAALVNALGARRDAAAVNPLTNLAAHSDERVAGAALAALGDIADAQAVQALATARTRVPASLRGVAGDAYLRCADRLLERGSTDAAAAIYRELRGADEPSAIRTAATRGLILALGDGAVPLLLEQLAVDDPAEQAIAARYAIDLPAGALPALCASLPSITPGAQAAVLTALTDRGDPVVLPAALQAAESDAPAVRAAAVTAVGAFGDASHLLLLARSAALPAAEPRNAARAALVRLHGAEVDGAILANLAAVELHPAVRVELIRALPGRNAVAAVPSLLDLAGAEGDEAVRAQAMEALAPLGGPQQVAAVVEQIRRAPSPRLREAAEKTAAALIGKAGDRAAAAGVVVSALATATDVPTRTSLIRLLPRAGGGEALAAAQAALRSEVAEVRDAAVRALADWPDFAAAEDLLTLARSAETPTHRILSLRGYIRLVGLQSRRTPAETAELYRQAMALTERPDERRLVLAGLADVPDPAALALVEPLLADAALVNEAAAAAVKIARSISAAHPDVARAAAERVLAAGAGDDARRQARSVIDALDRFADYITQWQIAGPFSEPGKSGQDLFSVAFPPESGEGPWRAYPTDRDPVEDGRLNLARAVGGDNQVIYLRTRVWSPTAQDARLELGSDDGVKAFLNGQVVYENNASRAHQHGQDQVRVSLREGWNDLMLKITNGGGDWAASARLRSADGARRIEGLRAEAP